MNWGKGCTKLTDGRKYSGVVEVASCISSVGVEVSEQKSENGLKAVK